MVSKWVGIEEESSVDLSRDMDKRRADELSYTLDSFLWISLLFTVPVRLCLYASVNDFVRSLIISHARPTHVESIVAKVKHQITER